MKRIWCLVFGHRAMRHTVGKGRSSSWTECGRCHALMTRGYFGWELADARAKAYYEQQILAEKAQGEPATAPVVAVADTGALI